MYVSIDYPPDLAVKKALQEAQRRFENEKKEMLEEMRKAANAGDLRVIAHRREIIDEIFTFRCPRVHCRVVIFDWDGCMAVRCGSFLLPSSVLNSSRDLPVAFLLSHVLFLLQFFCFRRFLQSKPDAIRVVLIFAAGALRTVGPMHTLMFYNVLKI
jgi:hypothetical protein